MTGALIWIDAEQGSPEWLAARAGVITASKFRDATERLKGGKPSAKSNSYCAQVALERVYGAPADETFVTSAMRRGSELEAAARIAYEVETGALVETAGLVMTPDRLFGYSTDGFIGSDGMLEIKCPQSAEKMLSIWRDRDASEYMHQIQGGMWITGRAWCDLVVYDPRLIASGHELFMHRIARNDDFIEAMEEQLIEFSRRVASAESIFRTAEIEPIAA